MGTWLSEYTFGHQNDVLTTSLILFIIIVVIGMHIWARTNFLRHSILYYIFMNSLIGIIDYYSGYRNAYLGQNELSTVGKQALT